jgi:exodeoxyribonuclease VII large subunit
VEIVARAIYQSEIPVISAVGHEVDFSIADFVADYRAPTPSAAAETISPDQHQWFNQLDYLANKLSTILARTLRDKRQRLERLQQLLERAHPGSQLQFHAQRLDECRLRLLQAPDHFIQSHRLTLSELNAKLLSDSPNKKIQQRVESLQYQLSSNIQKSLQSARIRFTNCNKGLETLSPLATLSRGYSISKRQADNSIVNSTRQVVVGDTLSIQLIDGSLQAKLEGICENT